MQKDNKEMLEQCYANKYNLGETDKFLEKKD